MNFYKKVTDRKFSGKNVRFFQLRHQKGCWLKKTGVGYYHNGPLKLNKKYTSSFVYWRVFNGVQADCIELLRRLKIETQTLLEDIAEGSGYLLGNVSKVNRKLMVNRKYRKNRN